MANRWGNCGWFYFLGSKITADGDCSHEIKRCLLLGMKAMANLDSILKSRDIILSTKVRLPVKAMVFPVVMNGCESWTINKAMYELSRYSCVWLFATRWTIAHQAPLSMGFSRQQYRSQLPFPSPGDLPDPGSNPTLLHFLYWRSGPLPLVPPGKP